MQWPVATWNDIANTTTNQDDYVHEHKIAGTYISFRWHGIGGSLPPVMVVKGVWQHVAVQMNIDLREWLDIIGCMDIRPKVAARSRFEMMIE